MKKQLSVIERGVVIDIATDESNLERIVKELEQQGCNSAVKDILTRFDDGDGHVIVELGEDSVDVLSTITPLSIGMVDDGYEPNGDSNERILH